MRTPLQRQFVLALLLPARLWPKNQNGRAMANRAKAPRARAATIGMTTAAATTGKAAGAITVATYGSACISTTISAR